MNEARVIQLAELLAHLEDDVAAEGFVAAAPDEDAGVVLVALVGGIDAIQQDRQPIHALARQRVFDRLSAARHHVPNAVRLHVVFVDDV